MDRLNEIVRAELNSLGQCAENGDVLALVEHPREVKARPGPDQPVDGEDIGRNGRPCDVAAAGVKAGSDFEAAATAKIVPKLETALQARARGSQRAGVFGRDAKRTLTGLVNA